MKDRFEGMKAGDRAAQAMLSPEGMEVYELAKKEFAASQNKEVRAAAKEQALAYARYCDLMAQNYAEVYNKPFTAKDYMNEILHVNVNAVEGKAPMQNAAQYNQEGNRWEVAKTAKDAIDILKGKNVFNTTLTNRATGEHASVGVTSVRESKKSDGYKTTIKNDVPVEDYYSAWANIDDLFQNADEYHYKRGDKEKQ